MTDARSHAEPSVFHLRRRSHLAYQKELQSLDFGSVSAASFVDISASPPESQFLRSQSVAASASVWREHTPEEDDDDADEQAQDVEGDWDQENDDAGSIHGDHDIDADADERTMF